LTWIEVGPGLKPLNRGP